MRRRLLSPLLIPTLLGALAGCDDAAAWGDANSIIVATSPDLWSQIQDTVESSLEPRIRTVRDERMFKVTFQDPGHEYWTNLRRFRQMLLIGSADDFWVAPALEKLEQVPTPPAILQVYDIWARDQLATILLLPGSGSPDDVGLLLAELRDLYERQYREWAVSRMFVSGRDTALSDTLSREAGFTLLVPEVYAWGDSDSVYLFRNDNPDPAELIRQVAVTWRSGPVPLDSEALLSWRSEIAERYYAEPQLVDTTGLEAGPIDYQGTEAFQVQAVWQNAPEADWPAAGPLVLRGIPCPAQNRTYLLDAWLYAPGKDKYEYMIQLQTILDSFGCRV